MKASFLLLALMVVAALAACDAPTTHPYKTPTAQNGLTQGSPRQPSTNQ